ncbi:hypothetical protein [Kitasatospora aureofaciens]|uniref:hypothetical protein n=1 Tax=Kitasatospora aureofaciens TaxID=1894 RepID=UPI001C481EE1|nr:hypothetical protein [Kitasatospora aureofaciens]MBV6699735.1 hypothetical protein [Kitasatospora aureofaciens]
MLTAAPATHALLKNRYDVELHRDGSRWLMHRMRIDNVGLTGEPRAIFGRTERSHSGRQGSTATASTSTNWSL